MWVMWMHYKSTRDPGLRLRASQVIAQGISEEGGLFVPENLPRVAEKLPAWQGMDYRALARAVFGEFLTDFSLEEISRCVENAYAPDKFGGGEPVKLSPLPKEDGNKYLVELWHGPTCAFKDMALQILPHFLTESLRKSAEGQEAVILVATSGDTGKAALAGFQDVPGTRILVFYPRDGVSPMQKRQMATQEGRNVGVCAIEGNFDDAQTAVKSIFTDPAMKRALAEKGMMFSSANSINWGRLLPQIVYYFYSYLELCRMGRISLGDAVNIVVPTGNFGNILAAYYASCMGLPVKKFICASNRNKVLTDFIRTGVYDRRREFFATSSPSMDILISSNLERLLYALSGEDSQVLSGWMKDLSEKGVYDVGPEVREKVQALFYGGFCDDAATAQAVRRSWEQDGYLCDTHTAVALDVYRQYVADTGDGGTPALIASTASPYKFVGHVLGALEPGHGEDEFADLHRLEALTHTCAPQQLVSLQGKEPRFTEVVGKGQTAGYVRRALGLA